MSKAEKTFQRMRDNPKGDWVIEDLFTVAKRHNVTWSQPGTSHVTFRAQDGSKLTVPAHKPIRPVYIAAFVQFIDDARS